MEQLTFLEFYENFADFVKTFGDGLMNLSIERHEDNPDIIGVNFKVDLKKVLQEERKKVQVVVETSKTEPDCKLVETVKKMDELVDEEPVEEESSEEEPQDEDIGEVSVQISPVEEHTGDPVIDNEPEPEQKTEEPKQEQLSWADKVDMKKVENIVNKSTTAIPPLSKEVTLYKGRYLTEDEIYMIKAYLNDEISGTEAADALGMKKPKEFYDLTLKYRRMHNIKLNKSQKKKNKEEIETAKHSTRVNTKLATVDFDQVYKNVKRGDTVTALAKDYGIPQSTFNRAFLKFIKDHDYEPINYGPNNKRTVVEKPKAEIKKPEIVKETTTTTTASESIQARAKANSQVGSKVDLPDGWRSVNGVFHLVKGGIVIR